MKIITCNVNGIRAAARKGFFEWMSQHDADVVCLQETKAQIDQLGEDILAIPGYDSYFFDAEKKGYSGVALYTRHEVKHVIKGLNWDPADSEGRYIQADFNNLSVISLYMPSGSSSEERQVVKFDFLDKFYIHLQALLKSGREFIICGDWNIAHKEIDLKNWRGNKKNSGFLPEERAWMDDVFTELGLIDAFRVINQEPSQYTWWSNRGQAWANNVGWRIDYQIVSPGLKSSINAVDIYKTARFSDHAPLIMEYLIKI